jgi:ribosomal protein L37AE/L43A
MSKQLQRAFKKALKQARKIPTCPECKNTALPLVRKGPFGFLRARRWGCPTCQWIGTIEGIE